MEKTIVYFIGSEDTEDCGHSNIVFHPVTDVFSVVMDGDRVSFNGNYVFPSLEEAKRVIKEAIPYSLVSDVINFEPTTESPIIANVPACCDMLHVSYNLDVSANSIDFAYGTKTISVDLTDIECPNGIVLRSFTVGNMLDILLFLEAATIQKLPLLSTYQV